MKEILFIFSLLILSSCSSPTGHAVKDIGDVEKSIGDLVEQSNIEIKEKISTKQVKFKQITFNTYKQESPSINGNIVAWIDYRNGNADIYMKNIEIGEEIAITNTPGIDESQPIINNNNKIAYVSYVPHNRLPGTIEDYYLYLYDVQTKKSEKIFRGSPNPPLKIYDFEDNIIVFEGNGVFFMDVTNIENAKECLLNPDIQTMRHCFINEDVELFKSCKPLNIECPLEFNAPTSKGKLFSSEYIIDKIRGGIYDINKKEFQTIIDYSFGNILDMYDNILLFDNNLILNYIEEDSLPIGIWQNTDENDIKKIYPNFPNDYKELNEYANKHGRRIDYWVYDYNGQKIDGEWILSNLGFTFFLKDPYGGYITIDENHLALYNYKTKESILLWQPNNNDITTWNIGTIDINDGKIVWTDYKNKKCVDSNGEPIENIIEKNNGYCNDNFDIYMAIIN